VTTTLSPSGDGTLTPGETQTWPYPISSPTLGRGTVFYVAGDDAATDLSINFEAAPVAAPNDRHDMIAFDATKQDNFQRLRAVNLDLTTFTNGQVAMKLGFPLGVDTVYVAITNTAGNGTTAPTVKVDEHDP